MSEIIYVLLSVVGLILFILFAIIIWAISTYNGIIRLKNLVSEGWSGIDVQLKRRANLVPNIVATVKGFAKQEKEILTEVTQARSNLDRAGDDNRAASENALGQSLIKLFAITENYPDLKSDQTFLDLQNELSDLENTIQKSRRYYNGTVREYNTKIEQFPASILAGMFKFLPANFFELDDIQDRNVPEVNFD